MSEQEAVLLAATETALPKSTKIKGVKRWQWAMFLLGGLAGILAAGLFARSNDLIDFPEFSAMDSLLDVLPANVVKDARDLMVQFDDSMHEQHHLLTELVER
jgi:hypothetical protein